MTTMTEHLRKSAKTGLRGLLAVTVRYAAGAPVPPAKRPVPVPAPVPAVPASVAEQAVPVQVATEQQATVQSGMFTADEMPPLSDIAEAAEKYLRATEQARVADRSKRAAKKLLDRLPSGRHGLWVIERVDNARETADLDAIRAIFKAHDLGDVPMKLSAASLKVVRTAEA